MAKAIVRKDDEGRARAVGGLSGHLWRGMSRSDITELGDVSSKDVDLAVQDAAKDVS